MRDITAIIISILYAFVASKYFGDSIGILTAFIMIMLLLSTLPQIEKKKNEEEDK